MVVLRRSWPGLLLGLGCGLLFGVPAQARLDPFAPIPPNRLIPTAPASAGNRRNEPLPPPPPPGSRASASPRPGPASAPDLARYRLEALMHENGQLRILIADLKTGELIPTSVGARLPGSNVVVAAASSGPVPSVILSQDGVSRRLGL